MAAGQGFKTFTSGEVLTAADVNGYLMQGVGVFADAANRDAEITSPQEGQFAYLSDTNVTTYYTGSTWANLDTTGMTNPMTTTGDVIYSSSGSTPDRLGIGTAGQVLQVNSGATAPEWATPAAGGAFTIIASGSITSTAAINLTSIPSTYIDLYLVLLGWQPNTNTAAVEFRFNNDSGANRYNNQAVIGGTTGAKNYDSTVLQPSPGSSNTATTQFVGIYVQSYSDAAIRKLVTMNGISTQTSASNNSIIYNSKIGSYNQTTAISEINLFMNTADNFNAVGSYILYGVK